MQNRLSADQFILDHGAVKVLLMNCLGQKWLKTRNTIFMVHDQDISTYGNSWNSESRQKSVPCESPPNSWMGFVSPPSPFLYHIFFFPLRFPIINLDLALWTASFSCDSVLSGTCLAEGVMNHMEDNCQVSSLPLPGLLVAMDLKCRDDVDGIMVQ